MPRSGTLDPPQCAACGDDLGATFACAPCRRHAIADLVWTDDGAVLATEGWPLPGGLCWICAAPGEHPARSYTFTYRDPAMDFLPRPRRA